MDAHESQYLNPEQERAVRAPHEPLLIVAGAGTGKTRTLTNRIAHLIRSGVPPERICALTFTNKAAREMAERVEKLVAHPLDIHATPFLGTFHSLGARILRAEGALVGRTSSFVIFDDQDSLQLTKKLVKARGGKNDAKPAAIMRIFSDIKNGIVSREAAATENHGGNVVAAELFEEYEEALRAQNAFDFDDLIEKVVRILKNHPAVRERYARRFEHLFVDEYQDINNTQYDLIRLIGGDHGRVSVVGDDQQTIYGWRGSNIEIFLNFKKDWPKSRVVLLEENYRSAANIVSAAQAVIAHNERQTPKTLFTKNPDGTPVAIIEADDEEGEAAWIADRIKNKRSETGTTAILYRTNAQSRAIEEELLRRHIPYRIFGGLKFYERREVKDILAGLRIVLNNADETSRDRLRKTFTKKTYVAIEELLSRGAHASPRQLIEQFLRASDYFSHLEKNFTNAAERKENIAELLRFAGTFDALGPFLEEAALLQATDALAAPSSRKPAVHLMTLHLAKGLEFDSVYIAGCVEGLLPHERSLAREETLEEERRLIYVGMTRARSELTLSFYGIPSRFLSEIPDGLIRYESRAGEGRIISFDDEERYITLD